jgi:quercetin dioxygenase-like cupin family protein
MTRYLLFGTVLSFLLVPFMADAQEQRVVVDEGPDTPLIYPAEDIRWRAGPGSFEAGSMFTVLEGDPAEPGFFTMQIRMPDGFVIAPHWHPGVERLTVLSGAFHLGHGEVFDRQAAERLPAGSHFSLPPGMRHYAFTEGETVVQLSSIGPWEITYVNADDDPRRRGR